MGFLVFTTYAGRLISWCLGSPTAKLFASLHPDGTRFRTETSSIGAADSLASLLESAQTLDAPQSPLAVLTVAPVPNGRTKNAIDQPILATIFSLS